MSVEVHHDLDPELEARLPLSDEALERAVRAALAHGGRPDLSLNVVLVPDEVLTDLHGRFLGDPTPTDVITFDLGEDDDGGPAAELYVSLECALRVSAERGVSAARELALYAVHGALHLCGLDDQEPEERRAMRDAERRVLEGLGYPPDEAPHDLDGGPEGPGPPA